MSAPVMVPRVPDSFLHGMNSLDDARTLPDGVHQLIENGLPGVTLKPRCGVLDVKKDTTALGYGTVHTIFRPGGIHVQAGGKDFFMVWHKNLTTTDEYGLEVWNSTDNTRTLLITADFNQSEVHFQFKKLYNAIYCVMEYEIATNHGSAYRTKNCIIEWNSTTAAWEVREMMIDVAPLVSGLSVGEDVANGMRKVVQSAVVVHNGKVIGFGGYDGGLSSETYRSDDGKRWDVVLWNEAYTRQRYGHAMLSYNNKVWMIGGLARSTTYKNDVWYSTDNGASWTQATAAAAFAARAYHGALVYNGKMWVMGGWGVADYNDVWYSTDGITWTQATAAAAWAARSRFGCVVHSNKMWIAGGRALGASTYYQNVYSSTDGITWTKTADVILATYAGVQDFPLLSFNSKLWVVLPSDGGNETDEVWYSSDGVTWALSTADFGHANRSAGVGFVLDGKMWYALGGSGSGWSTVYNDSIYSADGITWTKAVTGLTKGKYVDYAFEFVRRTDTSSVLASAYTNYVFEPWQTKDGETIYGPDEKKLSGTTNLSAANPGVLAGSGTAFATELAIGDFIRIDGSNFAYEVLTRTNDTSATVSNAGFNTATGKSLCLLPSVGDPITNETFHEGTNPGIEDTSKRIPVYVDIANAQGIVYIQVPDATDALAQGATHLRVFRTAEGTDLTTAAGLSHSFLMDIAIKGDSIVSGRLVIDDTTDDELSGETNLLISTDYDVPPQGRYVDFDTRLWIGGNPNNAGHWFYSELPLNVQFPQKYANLFRLDEFWIACDPDDGQNDTGTAVLSGDRYFFKDRKIFILRGSNPDNAPEMISDGIGCCCPYTLTRANIQFFGGQCLLFQSELGPAVLVAGGSVRLITELTVAELWPSKTGVLRTSAGAPTTKYTRNKVTGAYWDNTWWILFGDSRDTSSEQATCKCFGLRFGDKNEIVAPFQVTFPQYSSATIYEPQMLITVDNHKAYTFSHKADATPAVCYRLTRFCVPARYQDGYSEGNTSYNMVVKSRALYNSSDGTGSVVPKKILIFMLYDDTDTFTVILSTDGGRSYETCNVVQERQSGIGADNTFRDYIAILLKEGPVGKRNEITITKQVAATGTLELFRYYLIGSRFEREDEFVAGYAY